MPSLVMFGAGNIGRGFITPLFKAAGWQVTLVDANDELVTALRAAGCFSLHEVGPGADQLHEVPIDACLHAIEEADAVVAAVAGADLLATSVGLGALPYLGPNIARGLSQRWAAEERPLDILLCENGVQARSILQQALHDHLAPGDAARCERLCGLLRTSIGRMIPSTRPSDDPLRITAESYRKLPFEAVACRAAPPEAAGLIAVSDFDLTERFKLYLHNGTHAALAYGGQRRGCTTLVDCLADAELVARVRAGGSEACQALARAHASDAAAQEAIIAEGTALLDDLFRRYDNPALGDSVARVGRDPWRKLAADDRLLGAARLCLDQAVPAEHLAAAIIDALHWEPADDEPRAAEWRALGDWRARLLAASGLPASDPLVTLMGQVIERSQVVG